MRSDVVHIDHENYDYLKKICKEVLFPGLLSETGM